MKFKKDDRVKTVTNDKYNGKFGVIIDILQVMGQTRYRVESDQFFNEWFDSEIWFGEEELELAKDKIKVSLSSCCPRCGGVIKKIMSQGFFGDKFEVEKCSNPNCGWC